jgi:hypothetical protein
VATLNDVVVATASKYAGIVETPLGSNRSAVIDRWAKHWGMIAQPWCGLAISAWYREAAASSKKKITDVGHPSTWLMVQNAKKNGWVLPHAKAVPGASIVWPEAGGRHTELLVEEVRPGVWRCLGGNVSDGCRWTVRSLDGATLVCPPELRNYTKVERRQFWLEDTKASERVLGPWRSKVGRDKVYDNLPPARRRTARKVRSARGYAIVEGAKKFYGPYVDEATRAKSAKEIENRIGRPLRRFSKKVTPALSSLVPESLGKTT